MNQALGALGLEKATDKTFIGRIEKGFDFLGFIRERLVEIPLGLGIEKCRLFYKSELNVNIL